MGQAAKMEEFGCRPRPRPWCPDCDSNDVTVEFRAEARYEANDRAEGDNFSYYRGMQLWCHSCRQVVTDPVKLHGITGSMLAMLAYALYQEGGINHDERSKA